MKMPLGTASFQLFPAEPCESPDPVAPSHEPHDIVPGVQTFNPKPKRVTFGLKSTKPSPLSPEEVETLFAGGGLRTPSFLLYPNNALQADAVSEPAREMSIGSVLARAALVRTVVTGIHALRAGVE